MVCLLLALAVAAPAVDSTLLNLAIPDARVVAGVNLANARSSPFGQYVLGRLSSGEPQDFQNFISTTGFDPRRDLNEILFTSPGGSGNTQKLVLARGVFDRARLIALAKSSGADVSIYNDVEIIAVGVKAAAEHGQPPIALAFPQESVAAAGDLESVRAVIDRRQGGLGLSGDLAAKVNALSGAQDAWFVSVVPVSELAGRVPDSSGGALKGDALKSIQQASGGVKFDQVINVSAELVAQTAQDATSLADGLRLLAGLAALQQKPQNQALQSLLNTLSVKAEANTVKIGLTIPEALLESLVPSGSLHAR
jgi:hypothetical protein